MNFPFILNLFKDNETLVNAWKCIGSMLKIFQILYSPTIDEDDLNFLVELVLDHLNYIMECFQVDLIPKATFYDSLCELYKNGWPVNQARLNLK